MVTIGPVGPRSQQPRAHQVNVSVWMSALTPEQANQAFARALAERSLRAIVPEADPKPCKLTELTASVKGSRGAVTTSVTGIEGSLGAHERPAHETVESARAALQAEGFRVLVRELRECEESECLSEALVGWAAQDAIPSGWYDAKICGGHDYHRCPRCRSTYLMTSTSAQDRAPSLPCEVCGSILIEWGGSKIWTAELVSRGD